MSAYTDIIRPRIPMAVSVPFVIGIGLFARYGLSGGIANFLGVALWSVLVYILIVFVKPDLAPLKAGLLCLVISWVVEFSQLTPAPAYLVNNVHRVFQLVFGSSFDVWDLPAYAAGVAAATGVHTLLGKRSAG